MLGKSQVKYIQSLGQKKVRDEEGVFIAEGPKIVGELLESAELEISELFALPDWITANGTSIKTIKATEINESDLGKISQLSTPNKVVALIKKPVISKTLHTKAALSLVLDTIQDPGNLGTIIRIADWFGIRQIICSKTCADIYNPKTVQSTMGSIARVEVLYTELAQWLKEHKDVPVYAAALEGKDVTAMKKITEGLIVIGNESKGISDEIFELIDVKVTIPRIGKAESLNAAVATGIILSHVVWSEL